jgi:hypothetical protein
MEEVRRRFPAKWFEIKKWLGGMKDSYINYNTYAARCAELREPTLRNKRSWPHGFTTSVSRSTTAATRACATLPCCDPNWLANCIYAILRANDPRHEKPLAREGIVTLESLGRNLQRCGKDGDAECERLPAGEVALCAGG